MSAFNDHPMGPSPTQNPDWEPASVAAPAMMAFHPAVPKQRDLVVHFQNPYGPCFDFGVRITEGKSDTLWTLLKHIARQVITHHRDKLPAYTKALNFDPVIAQGTLSATSPYRGRHMPDFPSRDQVAGWSVKIEGLRTDVNMFTFLEDMADAIDLEEKDLPVLKLDVAMFAKIGDDPMPEDMER